MSKLSIAKIKEILEINEVTEEEINNLKLDDRKGVQQLLAQYEKKQHQLALQKEKADEMMRYERAYYTNNVGFIAGVDEVGRGPLAGPVVAAAVILPENFSLLGINDSKQLSKTKRELFFKLIQEQAISIGVGIIDNNTIDEMNIYQATKKAMYEAINKLTPPPNHVLIDAMPLEQLNCSYEAIIKGDQKSTSIASASIIAKVTRDQIMEEYHNMYPAYRFDSNSGYGTNVHIEALKNNGSSPIHRKSFLKNILI